MVIPEVVIRKVTGVRLWFRVCKVWLCFLMHTIFEDHCKQCPVKTECLLCSSTTLPNNEYAFTSFTDAVMVTQGLLLDNSDDEYQIGELQRK
jgi:hypothetical protein